MDILREIVLPKLEGVRAQHGSFMARCPAHDDGKASLSLTVGKEHPVVFHCHAGCERDDILAGIGLTWADVCKASEKDTRPKGEWTPRGDAIAVYDYVDEQGNLLYQVLRTADKQFPCRVPDLSRPKGWNWRLGDTRRVLYRLPKVIEGIRDGHVIFIVEGEKDVHALESHQLVATCNPGGGGKWRAEYCEMFRDADVTIICDRDDPGHAHARQVRDMLHGIARSIRIYEPVVGKDAADHIAAGKKLQDFVEIWTSEVEIKPDLAPDLWEFLAVEDAEYDWVVPGLLERGDRLVWTGFEGLGKSMAIRQMAVMIAAGLHPFKWTEIPKMRVLLIDCENSEQQSRRKFRPLADLSISSRHRVPDGALRLIHKPAGIDVSRPDDAAWLLERVTAHKPDVLFIGPFYRLHAGNINDESAARHTVGILDMARTAANCAMVIEAHAGHGEQGKNRSVRPVGSSLLLRWPEFGFGIAPAYEPDPGEPCRTVEVKAWRGARDQRDWPTQLTWGGEGSWPWQIAPDRIHTPPKGWEPNGRNN
ncbi:AAA family ATPase [Streptosporangium sp. NBC_01755]|uniref:AAA family ATPase n=1 Tax=unclassified Streptosporangium TaxID=2632669 RepID=UPI002DDC0D6E|nr:MULTISPECIES: AAA family ATPase [unclassified Streptosporangium]WSA23739.1 AAA family ATPase [Streptosporangium sp. NBC_01810]WSD01487.1 AAA family ATPase [Streptosporangium sp. NBC_01755]